MSERNLKVVQWKAKKIGGVTVYLDDVRVSGGKPWGGGEIILEVPLTDDSLTKAEAEVERLRTTLGDIEFIAEQALAIKERPETDETLKFVGELGRCLHKARMALKGGE